MHLSEAPAVGWNVPSCRSPREGDATAADAAAVLGAAILVTTAFRLRDEAGLISALRLLAQGVEDWESDADRAAPEGSS